MRLITKDQAYNFPPTRYEQTDLPSIDYNVHVLTNPAEMKDAVIGSGTCLDTEIDIDVTDDYSVLDVYLQVFNKRDEINFYGVGNKYARSLEFDTPHLDLMAIDAAPVGTSFDPEEYRAGINAIMRHAEIEEKDAVIGGEEFFYNRLGVPWN